MQNNLGVNRGVDPAQYLTLSDNLFRIKFLCQLAGLAPSSHNTQPWSLSITSNKIIVSPNFARHLRAGDPDQRELLLSLGAFLGCLSLVVESYGLDYERTNEGPDKFIYSFKDLSPREVDFETLNSVVMRHCNRSEYKSAPLDESLSAFLKSLTDGSVKLTVVENPEAIQKISQIIEESTVEAFADRNFTNELSQWIRPSWPKYHDGMPGYYMGIPFLLSFFVPWVIKYFDTTKMQVGMLHEMTKSLSAYLVLSGADAPPDQIEAGELFYRIAVHCQKVGANISVFGAPIEIGSHYTKLKSYLVLKDRPLMVVRIGYAKEQSTSNYSPRLNINEFVTSQYE